VLHLQARADSWGLPARAARLPTALTASVVPLQARADSRDLHALPAINGFFDDERLYQEIRCVQLSGLPCSSCSAMGNSYTDDIYEGRRCSRAGVCGLAREAAKLPFVAIRHTPPHGEGTRVKPNCSTRAADV
jgi:hypothetical protein